MSKTITITQSGLGRSISVANGVGPAGPAGSAGDFDTTIIDGSTNAPTGNAVFDALALKAPVSTTVTLAGAQTITGAKTIQVSSATNALSIENASTGPAINALSTSGVAVIGTSGSGAAASFTSVSGNHLSLGGGLLVVANSGSLTTKGITGETISLLGTSSYEGSLLLQYRNDSTYSGLLKASNFTGFRNFTAPDATGTLALTASATGVPDALSGTVIAYSETVVALGTVVSSATLAITAGTVITATLTASTACTFTMPTATAGKSFALYLKQAASTGNGTATFTSVKWSGGTAPTITATAGKMDVLSFVADGTNWYGSAIQNFTP